jgi:hypothetical protein
VAAIFCHGFDLAVSFDGEDHGLRLNVRFTARHRPPTLSSRRAALGHDSPSSATGTSRARTITRRGRAQCNDPARRRRLGRAHSHSCYARALACFTRRNRRSGVMGSSKNDCLFSCRRVVILGVLRPVKQSGPKYSDRACYAARAQWTRWYFWMVRRLSGRG